MFKMNSLEKENNIHILGPIEYQKSSVASRHLHDLSALMYLQLNLWCHFAGW